MTDDSPPPSCLESSPNIGIADLKNEGKRLCEVEFFNEATGFYNLIDVETRAKYQVYRTFFQPMKK